MSSERAIVRFNSIVLDKANASRGTSVGNVLVCVQARKQASTDTVKNLGDFEVWESSEQVTARVVQIKAAEAAPGGAIGTPSPTGQEGFLKAIDNVKREFLRQCKHHGG